MPWIWEWNLQLYFKCSIMNVIPMRSNASKNLDKGYWLENAKVKTKSNQFLLFQIRFWLKEKLIIIGEKLLKLLISEWPSILVVGNFHHPLGVLEQSAETRRIRYLLCGLLTEGPGCETLHLPRGCLQWTGVKKEECSVQANKDKLLMKSN